MRLLGLMGLLLWGSSSYAQQNNNSEQTNTTTRIDTIITFDPVTMKETMEIVAYDPNKPMQIQQSTKPVAGDTLIIFDPVTQKEEIIIIENPQKN